MDIGPENSQTGPAIRQDKKTINKHLEMLSDQNLKNLYLNLTSSIQKMNHKNYKTLLKMFPHLSLMLTV